MFPQIMRRFIRDAGGVLSLQRDDAIADVLLPYNRRVAATQAGAYSAYLRCHRTGVFSPTYRQGKLQFARDMAFA
jgi:hypothetical protein